MNVLDAVGGQRKLPGRFTPVKETRYPLYRSLSESQRLFGQVEKSSQPGFDPRTVQPVASRYTD